MPPAGGLHLEDVYDLTDYTERKLEHLDALSGKRRSSEKSDPPPTVVPPKPQATDDDGNCLLGCNAACRYITDCTPSTRPAYRDDDVYLMSGALPLGAQLVDTDDPTASFCIRDKQVRPSAFAQRSKSAAEASWDQAPVLENGTTDDQRGRARLRDIGRRLSSMSLACRNLWGPVKVPADDSLPKVEVYVQRNVAD